MSDSQVGRAIKRVNADHGFVCSRSTEQKLLQKLSKLQSQGCVTKPSALEVVSELPQAFFAENSFDSPKQYANMLYNSIRLLERSDQTQNPSQIFNIHAPVQVLQTGSNAKVNISQQAQTQYLNLMSRRLDDVSKAIEHDIADHKEKSEALKLVGEARQEILSPTPRKTKLKKILSQVGKWTGERLNKAVDTAIECGMKYYVDPSVPK